MYCSVCGKEILDEAVICPNCGCMVKKVNVKNNNSLKTEPTNKVDLSLILGIIGIVGAWLFAIIGHISSIVGIVVGVKEYKETGKTTGLMLSIIGEVCSVISSLIGVIAIYL